MDRLPVEVLLAAGPRRSAPLGLLQRRTEPAAPPGVLEDLAPARHLAYAARTAAGAPLGPLAHPAVPRGSWNEKIGIAERKVPDGAGATFGSTVLSRFSTNNGFLEQSVYRLERFMLLLSRASDTHSEG